MISKTRKVYVGIDAHSKEHKVAILPLTLLQQSDTQWRRIKPIVIKNNLDDFQYLDSKVRSYVSSPKQASVVVDNTGYYSVPIVHYLRNKDYDVYYLEPRSSKVSKDHIFDEEDKSDVIDCIYLAYMLYLRDLHSLSFRTYRAELELESRAHVLNSLIIQRWQYSKLANQLINRLHQLLIAVFPEGELKYFNQLMRIIPKYPIPKDILNSYGLIEIQNLYAKHRKEILKLANTTVGVPGDSYRFLIKDLGIQLADTRAKLDYLTSEIRNQVSSHPYGKILFSFPQIAEICAATIIGITKDTERWPDKRKLKKALGIYARYTQSGIGASKVTQGKEGNSRGRAVLFQICMGNIRGKARENDFRDYYLRQVKRGKPKMKALVSTMGKLAEIIYHCLKTGEAYQYQGKYR